MEKEILQTIKYFAFFSYPPSIDQIHTFLPKTITKKKLEIKLALLVKKNKLLAFNRPFKFVYYTLPQYSSFFKKRALREVFSKRKEKKIGLYLKLLAVFPQIKFVGFSGTLAMNNAKLSDDIDLFVITGEKRLWTGRFISLVLAMVFKLKRKRKVKKAKDKVCLNLFFDEKNLKVPNLKKSKYVAREVLQLRPIINKSRTYEKFLKANQWVYKFFPNGKKNKKLKAKPSDSEGKSEKPELKTQKNNQNFITDWMEVVFKKIQLFLINRHRSTEIITDTQLWFHPDDFSKKINYGAKSSML